MKYTRVAAALFLLCTSMAGNAADWEYESTTDQMTSKKSLRADVRSDNVLKMGFPYNKGGNRGTLTIRQHPTYGLDVMVSIDHGQMSCHSFSSCSVSVRFDDDKPVQYSGTEPSDNSSTTIFIKGAGFIARAKKAKRILVQFTSYQNGSPVLEFSTPTALVWPPK